VKCLEGCYPTDFSEEAEKSIKYIEKLREAGSEVIVLVAEEASIDCQLLLPNGRGLQVMHFASLH